LNLPAANTPETIRRHDPGVHRTPTRNRAAFGLFTLFAIGALAMALVSSSVVLAGVGSVALVAAIVAARSFPIDREW
jgi:hypothetical protein